MQLPQDIIKPSAKDREAWIWSSTAAEVPQVDRRIGHGFECVMRLAGAFEAQQQAPELVFLAEQTFSTCEPELAEGLMTLRQEILADGELVERVRRKYSIRNTHGYRLDACLDGQTPLEIFRRFLISSEGTLGFVLLI
jgi:hypothetical protein